MAVTLTGTGIQYSDSSTQTQRQGLLEGTSFTTGSVATCTFSGIPTNHQKIIVDVEQAPSNSGPTYTTILYKSQNGTSTFSNNANIMVKGSSGSGTYTYGNPNGQLLNYGSISYVTRIILEYISINPGTIPYYHVELYSPYNNVLLGAGTLYNSSSGKIDTISIGYSGGYVFSSPRVAISWE